MDYGEETKMFLEFIFTVIKKDKLYVFDQGGLFPPHYYNHTWCVSTHGLLKCLANTRARAKNIVNEFILQNSYLCASLGREKSRMAVRM